MKLEVGMYVRTNDGYINKIKKVNQFNVLVYGRDLFGEELNIPNNEITKASYNIINILEVEDYVNGKKIINVILEDICGNEILDNQHIFTKDGEIFENEIETIVTHEQMEQMAFKVEE